MNQLIKNSLYLIIFQLAYIILYNSDVPLINFYFIYYFLPLILGVIVFIVINDNIFQKSLFFLLISIIPSFFIYLSYDEIYRIHRGELIFIQIKAFFILYSIGFFLTMIIKRFIVVVGLHRDK